MSSDSLKGYVASIVPLMYVEYGVCGGLIMKQANSIFCSFKGPVTFGDVSWQVTGQLVLSMGSRFGRDRREPVSM